jgi:non-specific serine/threonine protein kinase
VTLTGPGGVGKTRLALHVAAEVAGEFGDGARFIDLSAVRDPELALPAIARELGLSDMGPLPVYRQLVDHLRHRHLLLVLDNLEQVVDSAPLFADLLADCQQITILATSRIVLRLSGEHDVPVDPLPAPEAVQLFVARARAASPGFVLNAANAATLSAICARLDGLPLAIELAAARVPALPPQALMARLDHTLPLLTGGARDRPDRLRMMRAAMAWSFDLLGPIEQTLLPRLAIFVGGFELRYAQAVCKLLTSGAFDGPNRLAPGTSRFALPPAYSMLDVVHSLVGNSLLRQHDGLLPEEPRFRMPETVREFGLERLDESGESEVVRWAHAAWCLALAEAAERELDGPRQAHWHARLAIELPNIRAALEWATEHDPDLALRLAGVLRQFWLVRGHLSEAREALERVLANDGGRSPARAKALVAAAWIRFAQGVYASSISLAEEARVIREAIGDRSGVVAALRTIGFSHDLFGFHVASPGQERIARFARAQAAFEEGLAVARAQGDQWGVAMALYGLASLAQHQGDFARATELFEMVLPAFEAHGDLRSAGWTLANLGRLAAMRGEDARAAALFGRALGAFRAIEDRWSVGHLLHDMAEVAIRIGREVDAVRLLGAADALHEADGMPPAGAHQAGCMPAVVAACVTLDEAAITVAWVVGQALPVEDAVDYALALIETISSPTTPARGNRLADSVGLTRREREVLRLLAEGRTDRQIAQELGISPRTVHGHVTNLLGKWGLESRVAAGVFAVRTGLA